MILIYAPVQTARLNYTMHLMLKILLGQDFAITKKYEEYNAYEGPKFSYGKKAEDNFVFFASAGLLFEKGIGNPAVQEGEHEGVKTIFPVFDRNAALPYDPFSAVFFMVSRYEEYMPYRKDMYGRFTAFESLAHKMGFLQKPVVHYWTRHVGDVLRKYFPGLQFRQSQYRFLPTYDIDQAWSFKGKGFVRIAGAYLKSLAQGNVREVIERTRVIAGLDPDPFDTYDYQLALQKRYHLRPLYFFLFSRYGEYDKNIPVTNSRFRQLIKQLADYADAGIHPSYASNTDIGILKTEVGELSKVLNREILRSRQHFLKLHIPETYHKLTECDIEMDYTMGFAALPGFRAGICVPYQFYDVDMETLIPITVVPFTVMDGTLNDYMKLEPEAAIETIDNLISEVKAVGGIFSSLWHNDSLSETGRWIGWRRVYEELVRRAAT